MSKPSSARARTPSVPSIAIPPASSSPLRPSALDALPADLAEAVLDLLEMTYKPDDFAASEPGVVLRYFNVRRFESWEGKPVELADRSDLNARARAYVAELRSRDQATHAALVACASARFAEALAARQANGTCSPRELAGLRRIFAARKAATTATAGGVL